MSPEIPAYVCEEEQHGILCTAYFVTQMHTLVKIHTLIKNNKIDKVLSNFRRNNSSNLIFAYLNINPIKNKFDD